MARLRYEKKDYEGALKAYDLVQLPTLDPGRATLYLEEAWTRYNLGQLHAAMGLLTTLDAPTFRDEFLPDKYMLRALIYRDLCHYLPAKRAAKELTRRFATRWSRSASGRTSPRTRGCAAPLPATEPPSAPRGSSSRSTWRARPLGRYAGGFGDRLFSTSPSSTTWPTPRRSGSTTSGSRSRSATRRTSCCAPPSRSG